MISESIMKKLENEYIARFGDLFPNMGISREYEKEIILTCLDKGKDAYELGYFDLEKCYWEHTDDYVRVLFYYK